MCLTIPGKVVKVINDDVLVKYDDIEKEANCSLVKCKVGDYVIVQNKFVMKIIPKKEALESLKEWKKVK